MIKKVLSLTEGRDNAVDTFSLICLGGGDGSGSFVDAFSLMCFLMRGTLCAPVFPSKPLFKPLGGNFSGRIGNIGSSMSIGIGWKVACKGIIPSANKS